MTTAPRDTLQIPRLIAGAYALCAAAEQNENDERAANIDRNQFVYFVDPNTVIWYCRPHEPHNLTGFDLPKSIEGANEGVSQDFPIAYATLDYIFSRSLPGATGQPLRLSVAHEREFFNVVEKLRGGTGRATKDGGPALTEAVAAVIKAKAADDSVDNLFDAVKGMLANPILSATFAVQRYEDISKRKLVRTVVDYDTMLNPEKPVWGSLAAKRRAYQDKWFERLALHRPSAHETLNIDNDAETLAELQLLNEAAAVAPLAKRFVLITVDRAIHMAMADWMDEPQEREDGPSWAKISAAVGENMRSTTKEPFARHPRQYMSLLNLGSVDNAVSMGTEQFHRLKAAANELASAAEEIGSKRPVGARAHVIDHEVTAPELGSRLKPLSASARRLNDEWNSAMRTAMLVNVRALAKTSLTQLEQAIQSIDDQLRDDVLTALLVDSIEAQADRIVRTNRAFAISGRLLAMITVQRRDEVRSAPRMPHLFRLPPVGAVDEFIAKHSGEVDEQFEDFLGHVLADAKTRSHIIHELEKLLIELDDVDAYAFSAFVAFRTRNWRSARYFAETYERAAKDLKPGTKALKTFQDYGEEVRYCRHVSERFLLDKPAPIRRIHGELLRECLRSDTDLFVRARNASELAALNLVMIFRARVDHAFTVYPRDLRDRLGEAYRWMHHGLRWVAQAPGSPKLQPYKEALQSQLRTNLAAYYLFRALLFGEIAAVAADPSARKALLDLQLLNQAATKDQVRGMPSLYEYGLALVLARTADDQDKAALGIRNTLHSMENASTFDDDLDKSVRAWFATLPRSPLLDRR